MHIIIKYAWWWYSKHWPFLTHAVFRSTALLHSASNHGTRLPSLIKRSRAFYRIRRLDSESSFVTSLEVVCTCKVVGANCDAIDPPTKVTVIRILGSNFDTVAHLRYWRTVRLVKLLYTIAAGVEISNLDSIFSRSPTYLACFPYILSSDSFLLNLKHKTRNNTNGHDWITIHKHVKV